MMGRAFNTPLVAGLVAVAACGGETTPVQPPPAVQQLTPLTEVPIPPQYGIHDTFVRDGIAFVCAWNTGLVIYDVGSGLKGGSPSNPVEISRIVTSADSVPGGPAVHNAWWFHNPVTGERRYVFVGQEGPATIPVASQGDIHVVDVADLAQPKEVAFYHMDASPSAGTHNFWMDEQAQVLYAAYYNGGVVALDVSGTLSGDLANREIARVKPASNAFVWGIQLAGGSVYATDLLNGLYQVRLSGNTLTVVSGGGNVPDRYSSDIWVYGNHAYTGTWGGQARNGTPGNAVKIWQLDGGGAPSLADSLLLDSVVTANDVKGSADGRLLAVSGDKGPKAGLYVYDLADPLHPTLVGEALIASGVHTARVTDIGGRRYVFAAKNPGSPAAPALLIYDVTNLVP
jgi:hypothetical protein